MALLKGTAYLGLSASASGCLQSSLPRGSRVLSLDLSHLSWALAPMSAPKQLALAHAQSAAKLLPPTERRSSALFVQDWERALREFSEAVAGVECLRIGMGETVNELFALALILALTESGHSTPSYERLSLSLPLRGLGEMWPDPVLAESESWRRIAPQEMALSARLWRAALDPQETDRWLSEAAPHWAVTTYRARSPCAGPGLSELDREILTLLEPGPMELGELISALYETADPRDPHPPGQLMLRMQRLCAGPAPLLTSTGAITYDGRPTLRRA